MSAVRFFTAVLLFLTVAPSWATGSDAETVPYSSLVNEIDELTNKVFRGDSYPVRFFDIPKNFKYPTEINQKVVMMTDKMGAERVFLLITSDDISYFSDKIRTNTATSYVFKPVGIYNKFPLLQLVEIVN